MKRKHIGVLYSNIENLVLWARILYSNIIISAATQKECNIFT